MAVPAFPRFRSISLNDKQSFDEIFSRHEPLISDLTFANLFCWRFSGSHEFSMFREHLVTVWHRGDERVFFQPWGENVPSCMGDIGREVPGCVFEPVAMRFEDVLLGFEVERLRERDDYVFAVPDLYDLPGPEHARHREHVKLCLEYDPHVEPIIGEGDAQGLLSEQRAWDAMLSLNRPDASEAESRAIAEALTNFSRLGFTGLKVGVEGRLVAFIVGERLRTDTYALRFGRYDPTIVGLQTFLIREFARSIPEGYFFLNMGCDHGDASLREELLDLRPASMIEKCRAKSGQPQATL